jgi:aldehyde:ferredoxin oxidoreductase
MANGYMGKILWVDLEKAKIKEEALDEKTCREYIGGYGLGAKILFDRQKPGADPLGPDNVFGLVTGPLTGTPALGGSRYVAVGKSPLTGGWGDGNSGGYFGPHLKFAGFDAVFFSGISPRPVFLFIDDGKAELRDASNLWGKDCAEADDMIKAEFGKDAEMACIGPAGEKLSRIAAVINNKGRAAARSGLGAVMGSKKLKAVVVRGDMKIPMADRDAVTELRKKYLPLLSGHAEGMRKFGTPMILMPCATNGDSPIKNWEGVQARDFPTVEKLSANYVIGLQEKKYACYQCPFGCGGQMKTGTEYNYAAGAHKPEYESLGMFGTNLLIDNLESVIMANDICNLYGLDTISTGACIAFAMECYENGIISKKDTDGLEMTWGNHKAMVAMTEKLARRKGFGDILADGVKIAAERIGRGSDQYAMHIQGEEIPAHDPKYGLQWALTYRMDPTPGRHTTGMGSFRDAVPMPPMDPKSQYGRAPAFHLMQPMACYVQSTGLCAFLAMAYPQAKTFSDFMNAVTGWGVTFDEIIKTGERIFTLRHAFNLREGLNPLNYYVPDRIAGKPPKTEGPLKGIILDEEAMDRELLTELDWDLKTTKPSQKKLAELNLHNVAKALYGQ